VNQIWHIISEHWQTVLADQSCASLDPCRVVALLASVAGQLIELRELVMTVIADTLPVTAVEYVNPASGSINAVGAVA
jgi:hypothetical protein